MEVALPLRRRWIVLPILVVAMLFAGGRALGSSEAAADLSVVTLFDGERGETLNTWGGGWGIGSMRTFEMQSAHVHSGRFALGAGIGTHSGGRGAAPAMFCLGVRAVEGLLPDTRSGPLCPLGVLCPERRPRPA